ncbi:MAG: hypothetical protein WBF87_13240, partial [Mesorhizobium sp.]
KKHWLINSIHSGPAYDADDLERRVEGTLSMMVEAGTSVADTMVDVTADRVGVEALRQMRRIAGRWAGRIAVRAAAYSPLGFRDDEPERWAVFEEGAQEANFIGCLPEADDRDHYPENIGFEEHCVRMLDLASRHGKMLHVHTDQRNEAGERGTERLLDVMSRHGGPKSADGAPMVWAVHMISPSTYDEARHRHMIDRMLELNVGVITCPSAAIGMRQLRPLMSPTYNSIPRVLELVEAGVHVRVASDNIADICSPSTTADLLDELFVLSAALRYYETGLMATLGAGLKASDEQRAAIREHLRLNDEEIRKVVDEVAAAAF